MSGTKQKNIFSLLKGDARGNVIRNCLWACEKGERNATYCKERIVMIQNILFRVVT